MIIPDLHYGVIALRDCGAILAGSWHPVYSQLVREGLAKRRPLSPPRGSKSVYRLTVKGEKYVRRNLG